MTTAYTQGTQLEGTTTDPREADGSLASRVGWSLVALFVGFGGEQIWAGSVNVPGANIAAIALIAVGLTAIWLTWTRKTNLPTWAQVVLLAGIAVGISYQAVFVWLLNPAYGTDAVAFDQYAARLALHGHNPYIHSMAASLSQFHVPAIYHTYRLDGSAVDALSYPAGSFLPYIPLLALGETVQAANIVDLVFWLAAMVLLWRMLPRDTRWAAGLIASAGIYVGFVIGGLTDALFVPFVLIAVYKWDRFNDPAVSAWRRWAGPLALGAAMSVKQTPWFLAPYLLIGIWIEARQAGLAPWRAAARYAAAAAGVFAVVNLPYIIAAPRDWFSGAMVPFFDPTIPDGQGLINLTIFHGIGGGNLKWFTVLGMGFVALTVVAFVLRYDKLKSAWVPLVALSFFLPTRSFGSYLFMLIPAAVVAATSVTRTTWRPTSRRLNPRAVTATLMTGAVLVAALAVITLTRPAPLSISIVNTRSTGQLQTIDQITVVVHNRTDQTLQPHFTINSSDHATTFWYVLGKHGPVAVDIAPHSNRTLTLSAPNTASMPGLTAPLFVEAFTDQPATVSTSSRYLLSSVGTRIIPDAIDTPVPVGQTRTLTVQAENQYGSPVRQAGLPIVLNQTVYGQSGILPGESSINGAPEGKSPIELYTNANGVARFTVTGVQAQTAPVYYQAWIADSSAPHGYSNQVSIRYISR